MRISQHSRDKYLLDQVVGWTGKGKVYGPYKNGMCVWTCQKREDIKWLLKQLYPLLGNRRQTKATELLDFIK